MEYETVLLIDGLLEDGSIESEIVKTEDGTLVSRRSLLKQSGKQVSKDASASLDNAKDAVKDLLKRK